MTHTPGPWVSDDRTSTSRRVFMPNDRVEIRASQGGLVACLYRENFATGQDEANARLIAAAPDTYDALKAIVGLALERIPGFSAFPAYDKARAAIAKAEGE
jgi:hypothetical protein